MMQQSSQAASKNRRLVQQLENRPSVIAALKLKKKSLRQRLGQTNGGGFDLQRLNLPSTSGGHPAFGFSRGKTRGGRRQFAGLQEPGRAGGGGGGTSLRGRLGIPKTFGRANAGGQRTARRRGGWDARSRLNRSGRGGGAIRSTRGGAAAATRGGFRGRGTSRGQFRGGRGGRGSVGGRFSRGRGRRFRGRGGSTQNKDMPSKQVLDSELDEYMAKSKGYLDAELENYMAQAHS